MPFEPIITARRASAHPPAPHLNLHKQDAAFRPATVKDKVKQWQGDGGGTMPKELPAHKSTAPAHNTTSPAPETRHPPRKDSFTPKKETLHTSATSTPTTPYVPKSFDVVRDLRDGTHAVVRARPSPKTPPSTTTKWDSERRAWVRKTAKPSDAQDEDIRNATSPKKRVISDSHWRQVAPASADKNTSHYISVTDMKPRKIVVQRSVPDFRPSTASAKRSTPDRPYVTRKPVKERSEWQPMAAVADPEYQKTATKADMKERTTRQDFHSHRPDRVTPQGGRDQRPAYGDSAGSGSDTTAKPNDYFSVPRPKTPEGSPTSQYSPGSLASPGPDDSISRVGLPKTRASPAQKAPPPQMRSPVQARLDKILGNKSPLADPPIFKNRIDAWLGGQSDPFHQDKSDDDDEPLPDLPKPKSKSKRRQSSQTKEPLASTTQNRQFSFEKGDEEGISVALKKSPGDKENSSRRTAPTNVSAASTHVKAPVKASPLPEQAIGLGINLRKEFPSTGKPLSTIASEVTGTERTPRVAKSYNETVSEARKPPTAASVQFSVESDRRDNPPPSEGSGLKRRLTKHDDLMTVLSMATDSQSLVSARTIGTQRARNRYGSMDDILDHMSNEEITYRAELDTAVDRIVPRLLSAVLARSPGEPRANSTQPVVDMGVALERLKGHHKRMPQSDPAALLMWARNAARIYDDYIKVWRTGFNDTIQGMNDLRDGKGDATDADAILKRPLIRVKNLTKTFRAINHCKPSTEAREIADRYHGLVLAARKRSNDEMARAEDEAASSIDPTRTRDLISLAPIAGVSIDSSRSVRARDYFDMNLRHSTGQQLDCAIEIIIRDDEGNPDQGGDLLVCEVSGTGRWLLFPPFGQEMASARRGKRANELVLLLRGIASNGREWSELLTLRSSSAEAVAEWASMLADGPVPPSPTQTAFSAGERRPQTPTEPLTPLTEYTPAAPSPSPGPRARSARPDGTVKSGAPSPKEIEVPIGEQARKTSKRWSFNVGAAADLLNQATPGVFKKTAGPGEGGLGAGQRTRSSPKLPSPELNQQDYKVWSPKSDRSPDGEAIGGKGFRDPSHARPKLNNRMSTTPSVDPLSMPRIRRKEVPRTPERTRSDSDTSRDAPSSAPGKLQKSKPDQKVEPKAPLTPTRPKSSFFSAPNFLKAIRRPSSPLKKEYDPSGKRDKSGSDYSDDDISDSDSISLYSDSAEDDDGPPTPVASKSPGLPSDPYFSKATPPQSMVSMSDPSLGPSSSASQAPYRAVPHRPTDTARKTVATIFSWSDRGSWEPLQPAEIAVVVSPGLIEAFRMAEANSVPSKSADGLEVSPSSHGVAPLVAFELTPLVPLRRGTALDISIRSPATANSKLKSSSNVMFRSRNAEECELLYNLINQARINNPTYIALQNARPANVGGPNTWAAQMDRRNATRSDSNNSIWFAALGGSRKASTYRSNSVRQRNASAMSDSSANSAFSALRKWSHGARNFSRSSARHAASSGTTESLSSGGAATPLRPGSAGQEEEQQHPLGTREVKIRLYRRENKARWRDMGSARLTVMLPEREAGAAGAARKRVVVRGTTKDEVLLDEALPEGSFERVARTGIAISVWRDNAGSDGVTGRAVERGGVGAGTMDTYMVQMKSEREAAYTFGLVGKLRY